MSDERMPGGSSGATLACHAGVTPEHLSAWRDGLLSPEQAHWLTSHAQGCPACQARLRDYDQIGSALRGQVIPTSAADPWPAMRQRVAGERAGVRRRPFGAPAWGRLGAVVAAALLVALFAGLLARQASQRPTPGVTPTVRATVTVGATATPTPVPAGAWTDVAAYDGLNGLVVAPSNPSVAYQVLFQQQKAAPSIFTLRRTDDQGASWHDLTPPSISGLTYPDIQGPFFGFVSPIDPQVLYLVVGGVTIPSCGANGIAAGHTCQLEYVSANGGQTWRPLVLPVRGLLTALNTSANGNPTLAGEIQAQGKRLYGVITSQALGTNATPPPARLVASDDGGLTWGLIDETFQAAGQGVYDYAATPSGSAIFVATDSLDQQTGPNAPLRQITLWRSTDGGASWTRIGPPPNGYLGDMRASWEAATSTPILYLETWDSKNNMYIQGSRNGDAGGYIAAPAFAPNGQPPTTLLTTLPDGSLVVENNGAVEAWRQTTTNTSTAWRPVTQPDGLANIGSAFTQRLAGGATRLWLVGMTTQAVAVEYATLQP